MLVSGDRAGVAQVWDTWSVRELVTLLPVEQRDWLVYAPDGRVDASPRGQALITWQYRDNLYDFRSFQRQYHAPGLWGKIWPAAAPPTPRPSPSRPGGRPR